MCRQNRVLGQVFDQIGMHEGSIVLGGRERGGTEGETSTTFRENFLQRPLQGNKGQKVLVSKSLQSGEAGILCKKSLCRFL